MAFGSSKAAGPDRAMAEINMVPLIDVVLVLLVLFILAAPMAAQSVKVSLPATEVLPSQAEIHPIDIQLHADGSIVDALGLKIDVYALAQTEPGAPIAEQTIRIWSDQEVRYEYLANLMVELRRQGYRQISLMTRRK